MLFCGYGRIHLHIYQCSLFCFVAVRLERVFSVTSNSRMMYAFSRDGAIPGSKFLHKVDHLWRSPIRAGSSFHILTPESEIAEAPDNSRLPSSYYCAVVWLVCALSFILGLPSFSISVAFSAATSIATIGLYISYGTHAIPDSHFYLFRSLTNYICILSESKGIPIALRVIYAGRFVRGPSYLGN